MLRDCPDAFTSSFEEDAAKPLSWVVARLTPDPKDGTVLGAFDADGALVGSIGLARELRRKQRHKALLFGMFVAPERAERGVGRELLAACLARARAIAGLEQVDLTVTATNARARRIYEAAGFRVFGIEERALKVGDRYHAKAHMVLFLRDDGTEHRR
jgi:RimJ/RimL family protein N-acetyltransferase